ncbi:hypothetical protein [Sphingomonas elodea]|nr:hypothetical protein [Sphingomonas elodea]
MSRKSRPGRRQAPLDIGAWIAALLALFPFVAIAWAIERSGLA